jgi:uncharacterized repeat protein (TIGR01451 family)
VPAADPNLVSATDNCGSVTVTHDGDVSDGNTCPEVITRTYRIEDGCTNFIECVQLITVDDTVAPVLVYCPADTLVQCPDDVPAADPNLVSATDNCGNITVTHDGDVSDGNTCPEVITRTYRVEDDCANVLLCYQRITVDDTEPPEITCAPAEWHPCNEPYAFTDPVATDNCDPGPTIEIISTTDTPGPDPCETTHTRCWRAFDACGNADTCCQLIITFDDLEAPVLICAPDERVPCSTPIVYTDPDAADNCDPDPRVEIVSTTDTPGPGPGEITHTRCWVASDSCGNMSDECCQSIIEEACEYVPLTLDKQDDVGTCIDRGNNITYTIDYGNPNDTEVTNVMISDEMPLETNFVSATGGGAYDAGEHRVTWNIGTLAALGGGSVELVVQVDASTTPLITLVDTCSIDSDETEPTEVTESTEVCAVLIPVYVDIRPGECPNRLRVESPFKIPVAILGTPDFDVRDIDVSTLMLTFEGAAGDVAPVGWSYNDVGTPFPGNDCDCHDELGDGVEDLNLKFRIPDLVAINLSSRVGDEVPLVITGKTINGPLLGGEDIEGSDCVVVIGGLWVDEAFADDIGVLTYTGGRSTNGRLNFAFYTKVQGHVTFEVFDVQGRKVATLLDEYMSPGIYDVTWDGMSQSGRRVPTGIYFARVRNNSASDTKKFMVLQ